MIYLITLTVSPTLIYRYATAPYVTLPTDNPPNSIFQDRLLDLPAITKTSDGLSGSLNLHLLDIWEFLSIRWEGVPLLIESIPEKSITYHQATPLFKGYISDIQFHELRGTTTLNFQGLDQLLNTPFPKQTFNDADLGISFGHAINVPVIMESSSNQLVRVTNRTPKALTIYDNGLPISYTPTTLEGQYELTHQSAGTLTADLTYATTLVEAIQELLSLSSLPNKTLTVLGDSPLFYLTFGGYLEAESSPLAAIKHLLTNLPLTFEVDPLGTPTLSAISKTHPTTSYQIKDKSLRLQTVKWANNTLEIQYLPNPTTLTPALSIEEGTSRYQFLKNAYQTKTLTNPNAVSTVYTTPENAKSTLTLNLTEASHLDAAISCLELFKNNAQLQVDLNYSPHLQLGDMLTVLDKPLKILEIRTKLITNMLSITGEITL